MISIFMREKDTDLLEEAYDKVLAKEALYRPEIQDALSHALRYIESGQNVPDAIKDVIKEDPLAHKTLLKAINGRDLT